MMPSAASLGSKMKLKHLHLLDAVTNSANNLQDSQVVVCQPYPDDNSTARLQL
jgi:hypothetical protein